MQYSTTSQLENIGKMIKEKRDAEISEAARLAALSILEDLDPDFDPRDAAQRISDAVGEILDRRAMI